MKEIQHFRALSHYLSDFFDTVENAALESILGGPAIGYVCESEESITLWKALEYLHSTYVTRRGAY